MRDPADRLFARFRRSGDPEALAGVFDRTAPELLRVARHLARDTAAAEDLVQATFVAAIEGAATFEDSRRVLPWLLGILANLARRQRRAAQRAPDPGRLAREAAGDPVAHAEEAEFRAAFERALNGVPDPYRAVLVLHLEHGLTAAEIARALDRPAGTVRTQVVRGIDLLRRALPPSFVASAAVLAAPSRGLASVRAGVLRAAREGSGTAKRSACALTRSWYGRGYATSQSERQMPLG